MRGPEGDTGALTPQLLLSSCALVHNDGQGRASAEVNRIGDRTGLLGERSSSLKGPRRYRQRERGLRHQLAQAGLEGLSLRSGLPFSQAVQTSCRRGGVLLWTSV